MKFAKFSSSLIALVSASSAFAHDTALPHAHPHLSSPTSNWTMIAVLGGIALAGVLVYSLTKFSRR